MKKKLWIKVSGPHEIRMLAGTISCGCIQSWKTVGNFYMERSGSQSLNPLADPNTTEGITRYKPPAVTQYKVQRITRMCLAKYWTWIWPSASTSSYNLLTIQGKGTYSTTAHWRHQENPESRELQEPSDLVFSTNKWQGGGRNYYKSKGP